MSSKTTVKACGLLSLLQAFALSACGDDAAASESPVDAAMPCAAPLRSCSAECVDTRSDERHCGACDSPCADGLACTGGQCGDDPAPSGDAAVADQRCADGSCEACAAQPLSGSLPVEVEVDTREHEDLTRGSCGQGDAPEARFAFTAPRAGKYAFSTAGSLFNTVLYVLAEDCGGEELACSDDRGGGLASMLELDLERDQTVVVAVDGFEGQAGRAQLEITELAQSTCCTEHPEPGCGVASVEACVCAQDDFCCTYAWDDACRALAAHDCAGCGDLLDECEPAEAGSRVPVTLVDAIEDSDRVSPSCASAIAPEALFAFTAPTAGLYEFDTRGSVVTDTVLAVLDGTTCGGPEIACVDDADDDLAARASVHLEAGQEVLIAVESWDLERGHVEVVVREAEALPLVCDARPLSGALPLSVTGDVSPTPSRIEPSCADFGSAGELLFEFTAPAAARYRFDTAGSEADTILQVLDGDCTGAELACNDDPSDSSLAAMVEVELTAGQTVLVNLDSVTGEGAFELSIDEVW